MITKIPRYCTACGEALVIEEFKDTPYIYKWAVCPKRDRFFGLRTFVEHTKKYLGYTEFINNYDPFTGEKLG